jgi:hypothetical protein
MRIVKPDAKLMLQMGIPAYSEQATIEITDAELGDIFDGYIAYRCAEARKISDRPLSWFAIDALLNQPLVLPMEFPQYLRELIELRTSQNGI